ncbi:hypothetical protein GW17_00046628 [Ensete ventricosum]|nr:hypothetical protein GW17_00046628 [Ensete ventricosum]
MCLKSYPRLRQTVFSRRSRPRSRKMMLNHVDHSKLCRSALHRVCHSESRETALHWNLRSGNTWYEVEQDAPRLAECMSKPPEAVVAIKRLHIADPA